MTLRLKVGQTHTANLQMYETLIIVVSQAFGGSPGKSSPPTAPVPQNQAQAQQMFHQLFR